MVQDVGFGIRRLVDIANKALSPAVNDPYTGVQAVHHLSVLLCSLARLRLGDWIVRDDQEELRVAVPRPKFRDYLRLGTAHATPASGISGWSWTTPAGPPPSPPTSRR